MNFRVIVDQRERNSELLEMLQSLGIEVELKTILVGDYVVSDRVCIERKTIHDFESSIISGRLFDQITRLKETYEFPVLILEGDHDTFRLKSKVISGAIAALYIDYGVGVLFSHSPSNTAEVIASIIVHEQDKRVREPSLKGGFRAYTQQQFQEFVIGNLPGIGPKLSRALLGHFKSIKNIANASKEELMKVEKIGKKKAERIHRTLNEMY